MASSMESSDTPFAQEPTAIISGVQTDFENPWNECLLIQKLMPNAIKPTSNNEEDAGYDLYSFDHYEIPAWGKVSISTQIAVSTPVGTYGRIASRSGLSCNHDLEVGAGVVDRGYHGEVKVVLRNFSDVPYKVKRGDKIAQLILEQYKKPPIRETTSIVQVLGKSNRGAAGFGSSGY